MGVHNGVSQETGESHALRAEESQKGEAE